jgi:diaminopimelate decarboxylase
VPYKPSDHEVDIKIFATGVAKHYREIITKNNLGNPKIFMENGRYITGPSGALITRVINVAEKYRTFVGVDSSMQNLMRPGIYDAYHHISPIGKENLSYNTTVCVTGSLCENNDQFAIQRILPVLEE